MNAETPAFNGRVAPCAWPGCHAVALWWRTDDRRRAPERLRVCAQHRAGELPPLALPGGQALALALHLREGATLAEVARDAGLSVPEVRDGLPTGWVLVAGRLACSSPPAGEDEDYEAGTTAWPDTPPPYPVEELCRRCPAPAVSADGLCMDCEGALEDEDDDYDEDYDHEVVLPAAEEQKMSKDPVSDRAMQRVLGAIRAAGAAGIAPCDVPCAAGVSLSTVKRARDRLGDAIVARGDATRRRLYLAELAPKASKPPKPEKKAGPAPVPPLKVEAVEAEPGVGELEALAEDLGLHPRAPTLEVLQCARHTLRRAWEVARREEEAAHEAHGLLADVCDAAWDDEERAAIHGYEGVVERVRDLFAGAQRLRGALGREGALLQQVDGIRNRLAAALHYEPVNGAAPATLDELIDAAGSLANEATRRADQMEEAGAALDAAGVPAEGEIGQRDLATRIYELSCRVEDAEAAAGHHDAERDVRADRLHGAILRIASLLGVPDDPTASDHQICGAVENAAWDLRRTHTAEAEVRRANALDAAHLLAIGGLHGGDARRALELVRLAAEWVRR